MPLTTASPAARVLVELMVIAFAMSEVSIRVRSVGHQRGTRLDRGSVFAAVAGIAAGLLMAVWCATSLTNAVIPGRWVPFGLGILLMWLGIALRQWAVWALGRFFTVVVQVAEDQTVVDRGPYQWVWHPSYTGLVMTMIGLGMALGNWLSLIALAVLPTIGLVVRIRVEERALLTALGTPYREYAEHRRRLMPGIW